MDKQQFLDELNKKGIKLSEEEMSGISGGARKLEGYTCPYCGGSSFLVSTPNVNFPASCITVFCTKCIKKMDFDKEDVYNKVYSDWQ